MKGLLDTSVVLAGEVEDLPRETAISAATLAELNFGLHLGRSARTRALRLKRLAQIESLFDPLPIDDAVARAYGEIAASTIRSGRKVRTRIMDLLIAATARAHDLPLYTKNLRYFESLDSLVDVRGA